MFSQSPYSSAPFSDIGEVQGGTLVAVIGVAAAGQVGNVTVPNNVFVVTGVVGTGAVGNVIFPNEIFEVTGVQGDGAVGDVLVVLSRIVFVQGVSCTATINFVPGVWIEIDDSELSDWSSVDDGQGGGWTPVDDAQTTQWDEILT
jgi:hypothetical protein